jgi:epoxide hydrolase-like predicted phosphatase
MEKKVTTFIFDCFGVICDPLLNTWYKQKSAKHGFVDDNLQNIFKSYDLGEMSEDDVVEYFMKYDGINSTKEEIRKEIDDLLKLDTNLADLIKKLKQKGFKIALLSNANHSLFERKIYTTYPDFKNLFDEIVISSYIKIVKPDKEIYLHALQKINSKPEESIFIDDSEKNIEGAEKVGIKGFLYTDCKSFSDYVRSLGINLDD